jgi:hypothetical protein
MVGETLTKIPNWEVIGLLHGLSEEHKKLCSTAFTEAFEYMLNTDESLVITQENTNESIFNKQYVSINDIKELFKDANVYFSLVETLLPMIRRVIAANKNYNLNNFLLHCRNKIQSYDFTSLPDSADIEMELCAYLSETYQQ